MSNLELKNGVKGDLTISRKTNQAEYEEKLLLKIKRTQYETARDVALNDFFMSRSDINRTSEAEQIYEAGFLKAWNFKEPANTLTMKINGQISDQFLEEIFKTK